MDLAARYPDISFKIVLGVLVAIPVLVVLFFVGRRFPRIQKPAILLTGLVLGALINRLFTEIRQRGLDDRVLSAAGQGDSRSLRVALDAGGSVMAEESTSGGISALSYALRKGDYTTVELLLQRGADPQFGDWMDGTGIDVATKEKRPDLVALLRRYGAH
ncbi:ankyrin repeat domain-containing protein [bacterium]|nr:MAG: ankyrin repeat domain-containing protein [bacterium]